MLSVFDLPFQEDAKCTQRRAPEFESYFQKLSSKRGVVRRLRAGRGKVTMKQLPGRVKDLRGEQPDTIPATDLKTSAKFFQAIDSKQYRCFNFRAHFAKPKTNFSGMTVAL